ncbi:lyso-ornithine lipid O-acyltransferase [Roseovarius sp.]
MTFTWTGHGEEPPPSAAPGLGGWLRVIRRGGALAMVLVAGVVLMLLVRGVERPLFGLGRPWTPYITQWVCRAAFVILGIRHDTRGQPMQAHGAVVANHSSWLDIFALNARKRIYFVSKSEVAGWPGIGTLARITGTVFINRTPKEAKSQRDMFEARLQAGHKLLFFPEGTSTDGMRVLPFKSTLFQAFFSQNIIHDLHIQPVTVIYRAPRAEDPRFYGWWGDMEFGTHLLKTLAAKRQGGVTVVYHPPVRVEAFADRKALAAHVEEVVRSAMPEDRRAPG